jgi:hypothetical protein
MTITPRTLYDDLSQTDSPSSRSDQLTELADIHEMAGESTKARLFTLVADTEALLADSGIELVSADDPAWDHDTWWALANTRDRAARATLLETIYGGWAKARCGPDADILLQIAETERAAAGYDFDTILAGAHAEAVAELEEGFDFEPGLADVYTRAGRNPGDEQDDRAEDPMAGSPPSTAALGTVAKVVGIVVAVLLPLGAVALVLAPATPLTLRMAAALVLIAAAAAWFCWNWQGLSR